MVAEFRAASGDTAVFAHAHILRVLTVRWLGLPAAAEGRFAMNTAAISMLGYEHGSAVVRRWNDGSHLEDAAALQGRAR